MKTLINKKKYGKKAIAVTLIFLNTIFSANCGNSQPNSSDEKASYFNIYNSNIRLKHDGGIVAQLLSTIDKASESLDCSFIDLTNQQVIDKILQKATRSNIQIRITFSFVAKQKENGFTALKQDVNFRYQENKTVYTQEKSSGIFSHNYCTSDKKFIWVSSSMADVKNLKNFPHIAFTMGSDEESFDLAEEFEKESTLFYEKLFGNKKSTLDFKTKFIVQNQPIELRWAPQEKPLIYIAQELKKAQKSIEFFTTSLQKNSDDITKNIADILNTKSSQGIEVHGIIDSNVLFEKNSAYLSLGNFVKRKHFTSTEETQSPNLQIFIIDKNTKHQKVIFYYGKIYSKSSNDDGLILTMKSNYASNKFQEYLENVSLASKKTSNEAISAEETNNVIIEKNDILISEIGDAIISNSNNDFIEIYNNSNKTINLSQIVLLRDSNCELDNGYSNRIQLPIIDLGVGEYYAIARTNNNLGLAEVLEDNVLDLNNDCFAIQRTDDDSENIDFVRLGSSNENEINISNLSQNSIIERCPGNNSLDPLNKTKFLRHAGILHTAGLANGCQSELSNNDILITEIGDKIDDVAANDYIEIYNNTDRDINLSEIKILRDSNCSIANGFTTSISLPDEVLAKGSYTYFSRPENTFNTQASHSIWKAADLNQDCFAIIPSFITASSIKNENAFNVINFIAFTGGSTIVENSLTSQSTNSLVELCPSNASNDNEMIYKSQNDSSQKTLGSINNCL